MRETGAADGTARNRTFTPRTLITGTGRFVLNLPKVIRAQRADRVDDRFAEKLMLAVTAVTECRHCRRFHTRLATDAGVDADTIRDILEADVGSAVAESERPALEFGQRYAETDASPGRPARRLLRDAYDEETAADIEALACAIYHANLAGNTADAVWNALAGRLRRCGSAPDLGSDIRGAFARLRERCPF